MQHLSLVHGILGMFECLIEHADRSEKGANGSCLELRTVQKQEKLGLAI